MELVNSDHRPMPREMNQTQMVIPETHKRIHASINEFKHPSPVTDSLIYFFLLDPSHLEFVNSDHRFCFRTPRGARPPPHGNHLFMGTFVCLATACKKVHGTNLKHHIVTFSYGVSFYLRCDFFSKWFVLWRNSLIDASVPVFPWCCMS